MRSNIRRTFRAEFDLEAAQLILDKKHMVFEASTTMNVGKSTIDKWIRQLKI
jgi:transposase-like protein